MSLTRYGVCYNFKESPYKVEVTYKDNKKVLFMFSTKINEEKFRNRLQENRNKFNESLSKRFKFNIIQDIICDITLYKNVETRGFLIFSNGVFIECLENILLNGVEVTNKN